MSPGTVTHHSQTHEAEMMHRRRASLDAPI
jgi:hypothetical protein